MVEGIIKENRVTMSGPAGRELYDTVWYGELEGENVVLDMIEAVLLSERARLEVTDGSRKFSFNELYHLAAKSDSKFAARYAIYRDLRERGLPVRLGFKGSDFRVYDRGAKPGSAAVAKWIVFASAEDWPAALEQLGKAIRLAANIRALALWAVADNDLDVTYYIINELVP
ncbi:MAG: tRNA-intron lyase [Candidatus Aenigmatarchaeota archaeon]